MSPGVQPSASYLVDLGVGQSQFLVAVALAMSGRLGGGVVPAVVLISLVRQTQPDVVHPHTGRGGSAGRDGGSRARRWLRGLAGWSGVLQVREERLHGIGHGGE